MLSNFTSKKSDKETAPVPAAAQVNMPPPSLPSSQPIAMGAPRAGAPRPGERVAPSIIGPDLTIMGNLVSKGEVQVDGEVQGDLHGTNVIIGERAKITGGVIAEEIIVRGHVLGSIRGKRVMLQATSHVEGDVYHQQISIEQGAFFEGKSRRAEDPTAGIVRPEIPNLANAGRSAMDGGPAIPLPKGQ